MLGLDDVPRSAIPGSSPAASASASPWAAPWCASPRSSSSTSRCRTSTPSSGSQMRSEIKQNHQRLKTTTVYVTHDQIEAMTMADRIVVMHDGIVEQIGTPLELYDMPANLFVAGFIGSPSMNMLAGRIVEGAFVRRRRHPHPFAAARRRKAPPSALGVRPEHFRLDAAGLARRDPHRRADRLGDAGAYGSGRPAGRRRVPRARHRSARRRPRVSPDPAHLHIFDGQTGRRYTGLNAMPASYPDLKDKTVLVTGGAPASARRWWRPSPSRARASASSTSTRQKGRDARRPPRRARCASSPATCATSPR